MSVAWKSLTFLPPWAEKMSLREAGPGTLQVCVTTYERRAPIPVSIVASVVYEHTARKYDTVGWPLQQLPDEIAVQDISQEAPAGKCSYLYRVLYK